MSRDTRTLISWEEFSEKAYDTPVFLINPYIPADGIVFLWGETSTGKSPVGWHMAAAVGRGDNFFGLPARQGRVLYLEVDTPQRLVHERVSKLTPVPNVDFLFLPPLNVPSVEGADLALLEQAARKNYDLVIINTLRKIHSLNDKEPQTTQIVYSYFQHLFPGTALVFVHHTKKTQIDANGNPGRSKESFSGAMNWLNDCQVGLHLIPYVSEKEGINIRLCHEKSQITRLYGPLGLRLEQDGASLVCPKLEELREVYDLMHSAPPDIRGTNLDNYIAKNLGVSPATVWRRRTAIEDGKFPGVEWLGLKKESPMDPNEG